MDDKPQTFPSNSEIHSYDISSLFIETRGWIIKLQSDMAQKNTNIVKTYNDAKYYFIQLFEASRHMIKNSCKVENWIEKERLYYMFIDRISNNQWLPELLIKYWRCLCDDIVSGGLYDDKEGELERNVKTLMNRI